MSSLPLTTVQTGLGRQRNTGSDDGGVRFVGWAVVGKRNDEWETITANSTHQAAGVGSRRRSRVFFSLSFVSFLLCCDSCA